MLRRLHFRQDMPLFIATLAALPPLLFDMIRRYYC